MNNSHDPLTVLHGDELAVQPDPAFAARLRSRLECALNLPNRTEGVDMSGTDTAIAELAEPTTAVSTCPDLRHCRTYPWPMHERRSTGTSTRLAPSSSANRS